MKTDQLIAALAADAAPRAGVARRLGLGLLLTAPLAAAALVAAMGLRPDLGAALMSAAAVKTLGPLALAAASAALAVALSRPEARPRGQTLVLTGLGAAAALGFVWALATEGPGALARDIASGSLWTCLRAVPAFAALPLVAAFAALRAGATLRPTRAGAAAGLAAGAMGAAVYSLHCTDDAPLFYLPAYGAGMLIPAALGALLGPRLLRW